MKKMLDGKFLFILGLSILVLIGLGIGAFYLFDNSDNIFIKSGYVLNPLSNKVEKYFFEEEVSYHENLSSMIEFKDIDNNNVTILKDSFLHYNDGSMSFLKNGAILDLNSINGKDAVSFYNITNESIIEKNVDGYIIKTDTNDINLKNFIGRINDDKYIVVGSLELKIPGNNTTIKGDYFEIVYTENGVVNIENREVKYQVTAEGTYIYIGDILIDLGSKSIAKGNDQIMSITAITINGDENIEIIPKAKEETTTTKSNGDINGNNQEGNNGTGNGNGNNENNDEGTIEKENDLSVTLENAEITSTDITVKFDMENTVLTDNFSLRVINLETGRTVEKYDDIVSNRSYTVPFLTPNTKYLFTVVNESDNGKYIQKILETDPLGISIEKSYAKENELGYIITVDNNCEATSAKLMLKKFNEETGVTETVKDSEGNDRVITLNNLNSEEKTYERFFSNLDSDSIYTVVLTDFMVPPYNLGSDYELSVTSMTLKKLPDFGNLVLTKNKTESKFEFAISNIVDEDNAIRSYTYLVYNYEVTTNDETGESRELVQSIPAIVKNNASSVVIPVGEGDNELKIGIRYYYKIIIEYFDNEKILEYVISDSDGYFEMETDPFVTIVPNKEITSYNRIYGTIYLTDTSCLLNSNDNDECSVTRNAIVQIINDPTGDSEDDNAIVTTKNIKFEPGTDGKLQAILDVGGLEEGTFYTVRVKAVRTDMQNSGAVKIEYSDESARGISTKSLSTFYIDWNDAESNRFDVVNVTSQFIADNTGELDKDESALAIKRVEISLYEGKLSTEIIENGGVFPITSPVVKLYANNFDIKEKFYDNAYPISSNTTFGLDFETLASISTGGKIQEYYTVYISAYYNESGTKSIELSNKSYSYRVDDALLRDDLGEMKITATPIKNGTNGPYTNLHNENTVIGYNVTASWEINKLLAAHFEPKKVRMYVYDENNNRVSFYLDPSSSPVNEIYEDVGTSTFLTKEIYMNYGSENTDNIMRRGNKYYIGFEIEAMSTEDDGGRISYLPVNNSGIPKNRGKYTTVLESKETPKMSMYLTKSTENSVTYWYEIDDPDNALYRRNTESDYGIYYSVLGVEKILPITDDKDENSAYNIFKGNVTIPNLTKGDYYAIYLKTENEEGNYPEVSDDTLRLFEGKYEANNYNFKFNVINNELTDNQVKIRILADNELISRIVNYKVTFTTYNNNDKNSQIDKTKEMNFGRLSPCYVDANEDRCLIVDYQILKNAGMKSTTSSIKTIFVEIEAMYDTGLAGYDYTVGSNLEDDYPYMIMQGNNTKASSGKYISFTEGTIRPNTCTDSSDDTTCERSYNFALWNESDNLHKGYYRYSFKDDRTIDYTSYYAKLLSPKSTTKKSLPSFTTTIDGRTVSINGEKTALNPKMLLSENMSYDAHLNEFSFSSYTPTIRISNEAPMINGEGLTITLSGADESEFCEENTTNECINKKENGTYKLYIDVWDNLEDIGDKDKIVRPTVEIPLDSRHLDEPITDIFIDKLMDSTTYYFRVYAWLNKNNVKNYTQLFDTTQSQTNKAFTTKDYSFTTWGSNEIFSSINIKSILSDTENRSYGDRMLNTEIKLVAYSNASVRFNYDVTYVICDDNATIDECKPNSNLNSVILSNTITANKLTATYNDKLAIDKNFEHGKNYKVYVYAKYDYYENYAENKSASTNSKELLLGGGNRPVDLLKAPNLNDIDRNAIYLTGESNPYAIEITPHVSDSDEVLTDGNYYVQLLSGNTSVGNMQIMIDGVYTTVDDNHPFNIKDINNQMNPIRFVNLSEDTVYSIVVSGSANLNNYNELIPIDERVVTVQTDPPITIYSTDEHGVGFGKVEFTATEHSIVVTFLGGSNISNITKVDYTIGFWSNYDADNESFYDETITYTGNYLISEHGFSKDESNNPQYIISPDGMTNTLDTGYPTIVKFYLRDTAEPIKIIGSPVYTNKK